MAIRLDRGKLPELFSYLTPLLPSAYTVYTFVLDAIEGKTQQEIWVDRWPAPKAVAVCPVREVEFLSLSYRVFAVDQSAFKEILNAGEIFDWQTSFMLSVLSQDNVPALQEIVKDHEFHIEERDRDWADMYIVDKESLKVMDLPKGLNCSKLSTKHAKLVNDTWKFTSGEESLSYIRFQIENYPSVGLFDSRGELLAFELLTYFGAMGTLYVMPEHRRKGYGSQVVSALAQIILTAGKSAFAFVERSNKTSIDLHQKLGFKKAACPPVEWINIIKGRKEGTKCT